MFNPVRTYKMIAAILIISFFAVFLFSRGRVYRFGDLVYGVTYSPKQAEALGLDWQEAYLAILDDLGVKKLRLAAYWDEAEPKAGQYDWTRLDWLVKEAAARDAEIILAAGGRLPRWPECHFPAWAKTLPDRAREERILVYLEETVKRYRSEPAIKAWQIENEPFLPHFGECPPLNRKFLDQEIALARRLDNRPIVVTDSGELSFWIPAARRADIFGTTMYLDTYSKVLNRYVHYPIGPGFFRFKRNVTKIFARPKKWLVIELQAEPWMSVAYHLADKKERDRIMNLKRFREIIEFARLTGFREFYLWGAEYWYWEMTVNSDDSYWNYAKNLFNTSIFND